MNSKQDGKVTRECAIRRITMKDEVPNKRVCGYLQQSPGHGSVVKVDRFGVVIAVVPMRGGGYSGA